MIKVGLEAKLCKENEVENFSKGALPLAQGEPDTITWYAFRLGTFTFGIFDT